jgi:hypothetical protein
VTERRLSAVELLAQGTGLLSRQHLRELGLGRRAADRVFRVCDVVFLPGQTRGGFVKVEDYVRLITESTYGPDRVRPT